MATLHDSASAAFECTRPSSVLFDQLVDLPHQPDGFGEGDEDLLVTDDIILCERTALAVLEPFLADLIATDKEVPYV